MVVFSITHLGVQMKREHEEWRTIDGWPYEVSNLGRVRRGPSGSTCPGRLVQPIREYVRVRMRRDGKTSTHLVHVLVAEAFLGPGVSRRQANHKNGDKADNRAANLEWLTANDNQLHALCLGLSGRGASHGRAKLTDEQVREIRREYNGRWGEQTRLAKRYGVSQALVAKIIAGAVWTHLDPEYEPKRCLDARTPKGATHGRARLTPGRVAVLRRAYAKGVTIAELAERIGFNRQIVRDIVYGKTWKEAVDT